jgi:cystathionine beta-lyase
MYGGDIMRYDFDKIIDRRNTESIKWDMSEEMFEHNDVIPMWIADMDFEIAKPIADAIKRRTEHSIPCLARLFSIKYDITGT